ncbi:MAG: 8-amino-7-oxononanoate synthase [Bacteroidota bacterium]|nr:8-amino-7-oxononanoate synthase [Bacteroidota bacterium]
MTFSADNFLSNSIQKRQDQNALRKLVINDQLINFCSNDYLGFASSEKLFQEIETELSTLHSSHSTLTGSTGSRLLAGNSAYVEELEKKIATFHNSDAGLIYNSGYDANLGLFSALGQKGDTIIYDELIHASVHDGIKLSSVSAYMFKHNDVSHLEERLKIANGVVYVVVESIYSMDGDTAPLKEIVDLCKKYSANLIVDEAHATGITTNNGKGLVQQLSLEQDVFARVHTFGKALGCHGAIVLGSDLLRDFLINFSRSFIYTTALPVKSLIVVNQAYQLLQQSDELIQQLHENINYFKDHLSENVKAQLIESDSAIQCIVVSGNDKVKNLATLLQQCGYDVRPILSPTVPKGKERLRICIHTFNSNSQIEGLCNSINKDF